MTKHHLFQTKDRLVEMLIAVDHDSCIWLTQLQMAELFESTKQNISLHVKNLCADSDFRARNTRTLRRRSSDHKQYMTKHYSLEMICNIAIRIGRVDRYEELAEWCKKEGQVPGQVYVQKRKEYLFKDLLEGTLKDVTTICYQYRLEENVLDFYLPDVNVAIEYDESHHGNTSNMLKDRNRERRIRELLPQVRIIRVREQEELEGLNRIVKTIVGSMSKGDISNSMQDTTEARGG